MPSKLYTGINIQYPISRLILDGDKVIETRTYPLPQRLIGKQLAIIETPGKSGHFKSRIIGIIVFSGSFKYNSAKDFYADKKKHCVSKDSAWAWSEKKEKWGWIIKNVTPLKTAKVLKKRTGIIYSKNVSIDD